jgi:hypothetical protein
MGKGAKDRTLVAVALIALGLGLVGLVWLLGALA